MATNATEMTVGELVTERPARSRVFEKHGVDYCCGGKKSLAEACAKRGLAVDDIVRELGELDNTAAIDDAVHYEAMALDELADHIVDTHHAYLGIELPRLDEMAQKVAKVHGETDALALFINFHHFNLHNISSFYHISGIRNEFVGHCRNMY